LIRVSLVIVNFNPINNTYIPHNTEIGIDYGASFGSMSMILFLRSSLSHEQRSGNIRATIAGTLIEWGDIEFRGWKRREESD